MIFKEYILFMQRLKIMCKERHIQTLIECTLNVINLNLRFSIEVPWLFCSGEVVAMVILMSFDLKIK